MGYIRTRTYSTTRTTRTTKNIVKSTATGIGTGIQKNPLKNTNFTVKTNTSKSTVLNILESGKGPLKNGVSKPVAVARVDGPHVNAPYNHINTNPKLYPNNKVYQALNHKPISNSTYNIAKNFDKIGKIAKVSGRALTGLAIAADAVDIYDSYKSDGNKIGKNTVVTSSGVAGSWIGAIGGAQVGASGGAAIGTAVAPGLGTLIGGAAGGIIGGITGSITGRQGGEAIAKKLYD